MKGIVNFQVNPTSSDSIVTIATEGEIIGCLGVIRDVTIDKDELLIRPNADWGVYHLESGLYLGCFRSLSLAKKYSAYFIDYLTELGGKIEYNTEKEVWETDQKAFHAHCKALNQLDKKYGK